ncbi:MAG: nicotinate-nucleotide adenylyltransferase [Desulfobacterales bacterium]|nr:nicotinate-nucleotide adenylyltransferase [Desulfobacterales bacterium]
MNGIGLFGGTFNPIHLGHLRTAQEVKEGFGLERVYFIPSAIPPHKGIADLAKAQNRYQMLAEAIYDNPGFVASDVELKREGRSYTIDTVSHFISIFEKDTPCYLIVGSDAFLEINTWKSYRDLFDMIPLIVMKRPAQTSRDEDFLNTLARYISESVTRGYELAEDKSCFLHAGKQAIYLFDVTPIDISSTKIRNLIRQGASVKYLVPDSVDKYIQTKGLYR